MYTDAARETEFRKRKNDVLDALKAAQNERETLQHHRSQVQAVMQAFNPKKTSLTGRRTRVGDALVHVPRQLQTLYCSASRRDVHESLAEGPSV